MEHWNTPYYVGLLSAAQYHGEALDNLFRNHGAASNRTGTGPVRTHLRPQFSSRLRSWSGTLLVRADPGLRIHGNPKVEGVITWAWALV